MKILGLNITPRLYLKVFRCHWNYHRIIRRLRGKPSGEKFRVLFINSEPVKWKCQKLYEAMRDSDRFEPMVGLSAWNMQSELDDDSLDAHLESAEKYFDQLGVRHVRTVHTHPRTFSDLSEFKPDIVIYNEQWRPSPGQDPYSISRSAITFFIPYYVPDIGNLEIECMQEVERFSYAYYTLSEEWSRIYRPLFGRTRTVAKLVAVGHPALDFFSEGKGSNSGYVIYAPHFSIPNAKKQWYVTRSTFDWSGKLMLEYARQHPEIKWVFKPHPLLRQELIDVGFMSEYEIDAYYAAWERIGIACYTGDYQQLFLNARAMITDCGSFLAEFSATGRPLVHLWCKQNNQLPQEPSAKLWRTFYRVDDESGLCQALAQILERNEDPLQSSRLEMVRRLNLANSRASEKIIDHILSILKKQSIHRSPPPNSNFLISG